MNIPLAIITITGIVFGVCNPKQPAKKSLLEQLKDIDYLGPIFFIPAIACLLLALEFGGVHYPWTSPVVIGLFCGFSSIIAIWVYTQVRLGERATIPIRPDDATNSFLLVDVLIFHWISNFYSQLLYPFLLPSGKRFECHGVRGRMPTFDSSCYFVGIWGSRPSFSNGTFKTYYDYWNGNFYSRRWFAFNSGSRDSHLPMVTIRSCRWDRNGYKSTGMSNYLYHCEMEVDSYYCRSSRCSVPRCTCRHSCNIVLSATRWLYFLAGGSSRLVK